MIVITGATGNIGRKITEILIAKKEKVRVLARTKEKLQEVAAKGAEIAAASLDDAAALTKAFSGADAVFTMIPPSYAVENFRAYQNKLSEAITEAVKKSGVKYVVDLSSIGAQQPEKGGPINGLYDHEQRINKLEDVNVLHLRPSYFMENTLWNIGLIKNMGVNGSPLKPDVRFPMIATKDIAAYAAERLSKRDFKGKSVQELHGERDLSMAEVTKILGKAIGKPDLPYVQFSYDDAEKAMTGTGMSADVARLFIEMNKGFNEGAVKSTQPRSEHTTTPTSIEEFAAFFAKAYKN